MARQNRPNPDDRSNNVERLQAMIQNTENNIQEAEISMEFAGAEERQKVQAKNERRKESIQGFRDEISDEATARENGEK